MGTSRYYDNSPASDAAIRGHVTRAENKRRMAVADKIVMAVINMIDHDIIRPGPDDAERECYVMAQELRDHSEHIKALVVKILKIEEDEQKQ